MNDELSRLFDQFDRGRLSRRQLLQTLGFAIAVTPAVAMAQGRPRGGPPPNTTPAPLPFARTGWKTVRLDYFIVDVADHEREAAYYNALMNWGVRSDNGTEAVLDIGGWGGAIIRGGFHQSAAEIAAEKTRYERMSAQAAKRGFKMGPFKPTRAKVTGFSWGIEPWNANTVEAELKKRGFNPIAQDHDGFEAFRIKDRDGFDLHISNGRWNPRATKPAGSLRVSEPFAHTNWKTIWLDHMSFQCSDYKKSVAFYDALLGWKPGKDTGNQNQVEAGDVGGLIIRRHFGGGTGVTIDHIAFGITPFDPDEVKAGLEKRGLPARVDTGPGGGDIHQSVYKSYHTQTPNGYDLQISATTIANRNAGSQTSKPSGGR